LDTVVRLANLRGELPRVGPEEFRLAMRQLASGVSIIAASDGRERSGMTATSVVSLSAEPPSLLVAVNRSSSFHAVLRRSSVFSLNILAASQQHVAERFTGRNGEKGDERFAASDWTALDSGAVALTDALAAMECDIERLIDHHTHTIVIAAVRSVHIAEGQDALAYWSGRFHSLPSN